jgi:hypothetical protein
MYNLCTAAPACAWRCCRFPRLLSFNGAVLSQAEMVAAPELFGPLDAALAAALVSGSLVLCT